MENAGTGGALDRAASGDTNVECDTPVPPSRSSTQGYHHSDDEEPVFPVIRRTRTRETKIWVPSKPDVTMATRATRSQNTKQIKDCKSRSDSRLGDKIQVQDGESTKSARCHTDVIHLPHLKDAGRGRDETRSHRNETGNDELHFPEITVSKLNGRLALNKSITDLLDPEMEILNKIKHMPRKKKRKRQRKYFTEEPLLLKTDSNPDPESWPGGKDHKRGT